MGAACSDVKKKKRKALKPGQLAESDDDDDVADAILDDPDEEDEDDEDAKREAVEQALHRTMAVIKRGKTMALKEAISGAKKSKVDGALIKAAEERLAKHKHDQRRDEVDEELKQFMETEEFEDIRQCEKMQAKCEKADVTDESLQPLRDKLALLRICYDLKDDEDDQAHDVVQKSAQEFFEKAISEAGRPVVFFDNDTGLKCCASLTLDPPVRHLILTLEMTDQDKVIIKKTLLAQTFCVISSNCNNNSLTDSDSSYSSNRKNFELEGISVSKLADKEHELAVAVKHSGEVVSPRHRSPRGAPLDVDRHTGVGVWIFVEATVPRRDRLFEALMLMQHLAAECA